MRETSRATTDELDVAAALARSEVLPGADFDSFAVVDGHTTTRTLLPGQDLVRQGDEAVEVFVLVDGELEIVLEAGGDEQRVTTVSAGEVVGEIGVIGGDRRSATVRALGHAEVIGIPTDVFGRLLAANPEAAEALAARALDRLRRTQLVEHFNERFGVFDPEALALVEALSDRVDLRAGDSLFEEGDPGDAAYLVATGRLRATRRGFDGKPEEIGEIGRSELVGEVSLVDGAPRTASIHAVRDTHLVRFSREAYDQLLDRYPRVGIEVAKMALARARRMGDRTRRAPSPRSFAVLPISASLDAHAFAHDLARALAGTAVVVSSQTIDDDLGQPGIAQIDRDDIGAVRLAYHVEELEAAHDHLVYDLDDDWTPWSQRALRHADRVVLVAAAAADATMGDHERQLWSALSSGHRPEVSLVLLHDADTTLPSGTRRWLDARDLSSHFHLRRGSPDDLARLGRLLSGRGVSLVLGGGGARGFAHLGVVDVLEDLGQPIDMIGGTSIGAIMAVGPAMGWDSATCRERALASFRHLFDPTVPTTSILRGGRITKALQRMLGDVDIADLWLPYFCVSTNLTRATIEVHDRGSLVEAVRASIAIPGVLPPVPRDGDLLVDGGLLDNVPVDEMRRRNPAGVVIAIDVAPVDGPVAGQDYGLSVSGLRAAVDRRRGNGPPHLVSTMVRATLLSSVRDRQRVVEDRMADVYLDVAVEGGGLLDFSSGASIADAAAQSTRPVLERWSRGVLDEGDHHVQTAAASGPPAAGSSRGGWRGVALLTGRDLQHRATRLAAVIVGTAVVLTLLFLITGLVEQFEREPRATIGALGAERWMVRDGASGAFTSAAISPAGVADDVAGAEASPLVIGRENIVADGKTRDVVVIGYEPDGLGEPELSDGDLPAGAGDAVIDESAGVAAGETIEMGGSWYTVSGRTDGTTMFAGMPVVFLPIESAQAALYRGQPLAAAVLLDGEPSSVPDGYHTLDNEAIAVDALRPLEGAVSSVNLIRVLLWFVAALIIGTMSYLTVLDRLRDMAVLKAVGARTRQLATSIAVEGAVVALLAAGLAICLQVVAVPIFPMEVVVPTEALWQVPLIAVIVSLIAGIAGLRRAVRVDPALAFSGPGA